MDLVVLVVRLKRVGSEPRLLLQAMKAVLHNLQSLISLLLVV